ncbi:MAG: hypothetical protein OWQ57_10910 [Sulfobacillus sp.]|nr:hypothetical protein [Sulfobacillus sp.]
MAKDELSFELLAAGLRQDSHDLGRFSEVLATKLEAALPGQVTVTRQGGLFQKVKPVKTVTVQLEPWQYELSVDQGRPTTRRVKRVRGVAIKTEPLSLAAWIEELAKSLYEVAQKEEAARLALERFLIQP